MKGSATLPASTIRKDWLAARRAVAMRLTSHDRNTLWRTRAIPILKPEHQRWVDENPATATDVLEYVKSFTASLPALKEHGIHVDILMVTSADDMRAMMVTILDWAERTAFRMEPHVYARKAGLAPAFADLHVITYSIDRWLVRQAEGVE